jgi:hypothetical protein
MPSRLDLIYRYRLAAAKCEAAADIDMEEIHLLEGLDRAAFPTAVETGGLLRGRRVNDWVQVSELGPAGLVCSGCPFVEEGQLLDVVLEDDEQHASYRFKARVVWVAEAGEAGKTIDVGLAFVGAPLLVRRGADGVPDVVREFAA